MRAFADVLRDLAGGSTYEELGTRLTEVVQAVMETRKSGTLTIALKIKPNGESSVIITDEIKSKVPEGTRGETLFFATAGGTLVRDDPRQEKLPLRAVADAIPRQEA
jgi:hypothetical protein